MNLFCNIDDLQTESDVEQKFIYPLLNGDSPIGLGYKSDEIVTKKHIKAYTIGKSNRKSYYPDYVIFINGAPMVVVEVKKPGIDIGVAFQEARLYANEINAKREHDDNPCRYILASNGEKIIAGYYDREVPTIEIDFEEIFEGSINFSKLLEFISRRKIYDIWEKIIGEMKGEALFYRPVGQIGSKKAQNAELKINEFGRTIALNYGHVLVPESDSDYRAIVTNAYVESKRREQHVEPIFKAIKRERLPSEDDANLINSSNSQPFFKGVEGYLQSSEYRNSLILLIGNVGSGKTTFIRYLQNVSINEYPDLKETLEWVIINMNKAPISEEHIYKWVVTETIEKIKRKYKDCDFSRKEFLQILYKEKINEFENGVGAFLVDNTPEYHIELFNTIKGCIDDNDLTLRCLIKYISEKYKKTCIIIFDNIDQAEDKKQLLIFQVAEWYRNKFLCLVILPLRDTTYNKHKSLPPLDTVIKDLVFRIDPPDLFAVLQARLSYICRLEKKDLKFKGYTIENGMKVILSQNDHLEYFKCILHSIRQDNQVKNIFYSITGKDTRSGIELFIDFCRSGHLSAGDFFAIKATDGEYVIENYKMMNAVIRGNRFYYSDYESKIKNLFASEYSDTWVDPFSRVDILYWLHVNVNKIGESGTKGFFKVSTLYRELTFLGHEEKILERELKFLIKNKLIISDFFAEEVVDNSLIRISKYGSNHIYLLNNIIYLAACSEDIYYRNQDIVKKISDRISEVTGSGHLSKSTVINNVEDMLDYLRDYRDKYLSLSKQVLNTFDGKIFDLEECFRALENFKIGAHKTINAEEKRKKYPRYLEVDCLVTSIQEYGLFVSIEADEEGFIAKKDIYPLDIDDIDVYDLLHGQIIDYKEQHNRYQLKLLHRIEEE